MANPPPFKGEQAPRKWVDYYKRRDRRPDVSIPADRAKGSLDGHYREYCARQRAKGEEPLPFQNWNALRNVDPSIY
jgi:hypothetical protein